MGTFVRPKTKRQLRHTAPRSQSHALDKAEGDIRLQTTWLGIPAPKRPSPERSFVGLQGSEWIHHGDGRWVRCQEPEEYADFVEEQARLRTYYYDQTQRKGVPERRRRKSTTPVEIATVSYAPWLSDWAADALAAGRDPRPLLGKIHGVWKQSVAVLVNGQRFILGMATHTDTSDLHLDLLMSRQTTDGQRIGKAGLNLVGPWCVGVDRQLRSGATISPNKRAQFSSSVANFKHRYGAGAIPLDVAFARALDAAAEQVIGIDLLPYRKAYADRVPELERGHLQAQLAALEAAKLKLIQGAPLATPPEQRREISLSR